MTEAILPEQIDHLLSRWLVGSSQPLPASHVPEAWRGDGEVDELTVLALAGQCRQFLWHPTVPVTASSGRPLPSPALRLLPARLRLHFRRVAKAAPAASLTALLHMLALRGHMAHPFDWLPSTTQDDLPEAYEPWRAWVAAQQLRPSSGVESDALEELSPALRRQQLRQLRETDPALARCQVEALLPSLTAEQRLPLIELLSEGLGPDDLPLLEQLTSDRSEKVRQVAARLRARLGQTATLDQAAQDEVRAWFDVGKSGLLNRRLRVQLQGLKTRPQRAARRALLGKVSWADLCSLLQLEPMAMAQAWVGADEDDDALWECAIHTAPQPVVECLLQRMMFRDLQLAGNPGLAYAWSLALNRLPAALRAELAQRALREASLVDSFADLQRLAGGQPIEVDLPILRAGPLWSRYQTTVTAQLNDGPGADSTLAHENIALAALLPRPVAKALLQLLTQSGVHPGDPALDALVLNAELEHTATDIGAKS